MTHTAINTSTAIQGCVDTCTECHAACWEAINSCLVHVPHVDSEHVALLLTCADMCSTNANALIRSAFGRAITCRACAEVCLLCAEACEKIRGEAQMQRCAEMCRRCAACCEVIAAQ
jgi:hypothetical protein